MVVRLSAGADSSRRAGRHKRGAHKPITGRGADPWASRFSAKGYPAAEEAIHETGDSGAYEEADLLAHSMAVRPLS
jgi:RES domain-containing protein